MIIELSLQRLITVSPGSSSAEIRSSNLLKGRDAKHFDSSNGKGTTSFSTALFRFLSPETLLPPVCLIGSLIGCPRPVEHPRLQWPGCIQLDLRVMVLSWFALVPRASPTQFCYQVSALTLVPEPPPRLSEVPAQHCPCWPSAACWRIQVRIPKLYLYQEVTPV